jgi:serine/threonine protein kinase/Tol biopolymer transport system component
MEQVHAGDTLGHYRILHALGAGGMGEVYAADDTRLHRTVALKVLPVVFATDPDRRRRFEREAQTIAALNHPGIVTIHSIEVDGPVPFLTMELVDGRPLRDVIEKGGMRLDALLRVSIAMTDAIAAAHQRGIVHRDLKPANVMVGAGGRIKVLDFGLAKVHDAEQASAGEAPTHLPTNDLTGEGRIVGTLAYMSPEQAEGKSVDQRSDIFSLGVMLHEMATGERPFKGDTGVSVISAIIKDSPASVTDSRPELPFQLARIIKRCLIKDPQRRYQSARDLHTDLEDLKQDIDSGVLSTPSGLPERDRPAKSFRVPKAVAYSGAAIVLVLVGIGAWTTVNRRLTAPHRFVPGEFQRLTDSGGALSMALSADGRYLAYAESDSGRESLWIRQTGTGTKAQILPPTDRRLADVAFSPDGNLVYYTAGPSDSRVAALYRISALGGAATRVLDNASGNVSFSPDGKEFSFTREESVGKSAVMAARIDGSGVRQLALCDPPRMFSDMPAAWSPDGRTIIAIETGATLADKPRLVAVDAASGRLTLFGSDWVDLEGVAWMPDGRSLVVAGADALPPSHIQLWQVAWPGGTREQLTFGLSNYNNVGVSADGRTVSAIQDEYSSSIWDQPLTGGSGRQITPSLRGSGVQGLAWTPDGHLVYSTWTDRDPPQLWVTDTAGGPAKQLSTVFAIDPAVSPDGKWIYFSGGTSPPAIAIWKLPIEGGDPAPLTTGRTDAGPVVSADGKWVYFTTREGLLSRAMKVSVDGGPTAALTDLSQGFILSRLSADGSHLMGYAINPATHRRQRVTLSVNGGPLEFVENVPSNGGPLPDGTARLHTDTRDGVHGLFLKPLAGGVEKLLMDVGQEDVAEIAYSKDSRRVAVVRGHETSDVVLIHAK